MIRKYRGAWGLLFVLSLAASPLYAQSAGSAEPRAVASKPNLAPTQADPYRYAQPSKQTPEYQGPPPGTDNVQVRPIVHTSPPAAGAQVAVPFPGTVPRDQSNSSQGH